jgi:hypothetical protein
MDWQVVVTRLRDAREVLRGNIAVVNEPAFDPGDVAGLVHTVRAIRRGDGHTVVRWKISKAWGPVLSCDVRAEHARQYAEAWTRATTAVEQADPDQDWSVDPIRDSWSQWGPPFDPAWMDEVEALPL